MEETKYTKEEILQAVRKEYFSAFGSIGHDNGRLYLIEGIMHCAFNNLEEEKKPKNYG